MITFKKGNIFDSDAQVLVCPVNLAGTMGAGLANEFKLRVSGLEDALKKVTRTGKIGIGQSYLVQIFGTHDVLLFPTKMHWKNPSKLEYIELGLIDFIDLYKEIDHERYAFPLLGCGLGGLKKEVVIPLMERYLSPLPLEIEIWEN